MAVIPASSPVRTSIRATATALPAQRQPRAFNLVKVNEVEYGTGSKVKVDYVHNVCQQCANPACMAKYPDQIYKRADGIVIIDPDKAKVTRKW
jgi:nitrate reductase beta subunit